MTRPSQHLRCEPLEDRATPSATLATGATPGQPPEVRVFDDAGTELTRFRAYDDAFTGGVNVAVGDVTGDGAPDVVTAPKGGGGSNVRVFDGTTFALVRSFYAFDPTFTGGVSVATANVTADEPFSVGEDIIVGAGAGGGPQVAVFRGRTGELVTSFYAFDPSFTGGVNVAATGGYWTRDYPPSLTILTTPPLTWKEGTVVVGAGAGGAPHVKQVGVDTLAVQQSFYAYDPSFRGGVDVAASISQFSVRRGSLVAKLWFEDTTYDHTTQLLGTMIVTGAGDGGGSHVKSFFQATTWWGVGLSEAQTELKELGGFYAGTPADRHGVSVAFRDGEVVTATRQPDDRIRTVSFSYLLEGVDSATVTETDFGKSLADSGVTGTIPKTIRLPPVAIAAPTPPATPLPTPTGLIPLVSS
jgi:hypothetical protein